MAFTRHSLCFYYSYEYSPNQDTMTDRIFLTRSAQHVAHTPSTYWSRQESENGFVICSCSMELCLRRNKFFWWNIERNAFIALESDEDNRAVRKHQFRPVKSYGNSSSCGLFCRPLRIQRRRRNPINAGSNKGKFFFSS